MRTVAEWFVLGEATTAEFWVFNGASDVAIGINEVDCSCDANGSALRIYEDLDILAHSLTF